MRNARVLVVEDEAIVAEDIATSLKHLGYTVPAIVDSGEAAIKLTGEIQPDLVLMDIVLSGAIDGVEAASKIRQEFQIPVVYLTAYADTGTLERTRTTEPFGYLVKPFRNRDLQATIEVALQRHQLETAREEVLQEQAARKDLETRQIAETVHEFRNSLNTILLATHSLERYGAKWSEAQLLNHIQRIQSATRLLNQWLEDLLVICRARAGRLNCCPHSLDLVQFCRSLLAEMQLRSTPLHCLTLEVTQECLRTETDEKLLRHILTNLLINAIKYSPQGGTIHFKLWQEENSINFCIKDTGIGIPVENQAQLFDTFCRGNNVGNIPGTGLGLAIAKKCVDLLGGNISLESKVGVGTTVWVRLPLHQPHASRNGTL